jgi:hypothetical protein
MATLDLSPAILDLVLYRGDFAPFIINLKTATGATTTFDSATENWTASVGIKTTAGVSATGSPISATITSTSVITFTLPATTTSTLVPGTTYQYDVQLKKTVSETVTNVLTILQGTITVKGDIV